MAKRAKKEQIDGLSSDLLKKIHRALGQVRVWSTPVRIAKKRALGPDGFYRCENKKCKDKGKPIPKIHVDHIKPIGIIGGPEYIERMFCSSKGLQILCPPCHRQKTPKDNKRARKDRAKRKVRETKIKDFF